MSTTLLEAKLELVPQSPGVYLMKDAAGSVIYVGKAVQLKSRLRSYFAAKVQGNAKVLALVSHITDFDFIVCANELEALILEANLIKEHQPHYNILLRDDKGYPYIRVTMNETYPRLLKAFRIGRDRQEGARYYGPYLAGDLYRALDALRHIFPTKTCRRVLPRDIGKERPCLNYYIGRCVGPCRGDVPVETYRQVMEKICLFLEGRYSGIMVDLQKQMQQAADRLDFEQAALYRDRITALEKIMEKQQAVSTKEYDADIIGLAANGTEICLQKLEVREGRIIATPTFFLPEGDDEKEILLAFIAWHYPDTANIPPEIVLPVDFSDNPVLTAFLRKLKSGKVDLIRPQRGRKKQLLDMAAANASQSLQRHTLLGGSKDTSLRKALKKLAELTAEDAALTRIEAYDISNLGRDDIAGSMVVFAEGRPAKKHYRYFKIKQQEEQDDYRAMQEMLRRRFARLSDETFGRKPDLILLDGGLGHVNMAQTLLQEHNLHIPLAGIVKDKRHRTRGLALADGQVIELVVDKLYSEKEVAADYEGENERLWRVAERVTSYDQDEQSTSLALLRLLTAIQNEMHRFAHSYQRKLGKKRTMRFSLEDIKGIGPQRRRLLLKHFGSIKRVSEASLAELQAVKGLGKPAAKAVFEHFQAKEKVEY